MPKRTTPARRETPGAEAVMLTGLAFTALAVAYLTVFSIAGEPAYAYRLTNGEFPSGFNPISGQMGMMIGLPCALFAGWVFFRGLRVPNASTSLRVTVTVGRVACLVLVPLAALAWGLTIRF